MEAPPRTLQHLIDLAKASPPIRVAVADAAQPVVIEWPKVAAVSAVETVNPAIVSTVDAAAVTLMARRRQIHGAIVDGPFALDNAVSADAAREKGIVSDVAGDADILLVPDLVSGNMIAKELEFLAGAGGRGGGPRRSGRADLPSRSAARKARVACAGRAHASLYAQAGAENRGAGGQSSMQSATGTRVPTGACGEPMIVREPNPCAR